MSETEQQFAAQTTVQKNTKISFHPEVLEKEFDSILSNPTKLEQVLEWARLCKQPDVIKIEEELNNGYDYEEAPIDFAAEYLGFYPTDEKGLSNQVLSDLALNYYFFQKAKETLQQLIPDYHELLEEVFGRTVQCVSYPFHGFYSHRSRRSHGNRYHLIAFGPKSYNSTTEREKIFNKIDKALLSLIHEFGHILVDEVLKKENDQATYENSLAFVVHEAVAQTVEHESLFISDYNSNELAQKIDFEKYIWNKIKHAAYDNFRSNSSGSKKGLEVRARQLERQWYWQKLPTLLKAIFSGNNPVRIACEENPFRLSNIHAMRYTEGARLAIHLRRNGWTLADLPILFSELQAIVKQVTGTDEFEMMYDIPVSRDKNSIYEQVIKKLFALKKGKVPPDLVSTTHPIKASKNVVT